MWKLIQPIAFWILGHQGIVWGTIIADRKHTLSLRWWSEICPQLPAHTEQRIMAVLYLAVHECSTINIRYLF